MAALAEGCLLFALKRLNYAFKLMDFVFKSMDFVFHMRFLDAFTYNTLQLNDDVMRQTPSLRLLDLVQRQLQILLRLPAPEEKR